MKKERLDREAKEAQSIGMVYMNGCLLDEQLKLLVVCKRCGQKGHKDARSSACPYNSKLLLPSSHIQCADYMISCRATTKKEGRGCKTGGAQGKKVARQASSSGSMSFVHKSWNL